MEAMETCSLSEAAGIVGCTLEHMRRLVRTNRVKAKRVPWGSRHKLEPYRQSAIDYKEGRSEGNGYTEE